MAEERTKEKLIPRALMAESPNGEATPSNTNPDSGGSNQLKQSDCSACPSPSTTKTKATEAGGNGTGNNAKSCRGCLFYSSSFKGDYRGPLCVGVTGSVPTTKVPKSFARQIEEASKDAKTPLAFKYACVGYSLYNDRKDQATAGQQTKPEFPFCRGLKLLGYAYITNDNAKTALAPSHIQSKDGNGLPQKGSPEPTRATGDEFFSRFTKSANLVANGVAKNIQRVGNRIKQSLDDIMYPRPK